MRRPLLDTPTGGQKSLRTFLSSPVRGMNARDNPLALSPNDALDLINFIAYPDRVDSRSGSALASETPEEIFSIMSHVEGTDTQIFAAGATGVYDCSTPTATLAFACTNSDYLGFNFAAGATNYLYALNGVDAPQLYDGSTWQAVTSVSVPIAITGISPADLVAGVPYNERIFFLKPNQKSFYYLPVGQVGGVLTEYPVGRYLARGGFLRCINVVNLDGGDGLKAYLVVASTEGEVLVFQGTDPADPTVWNLRGSYVVGKPLNKHSLMPYGSDTLYLCEAGIYGLIESLTGARIGKAITVSDRIGPLLSRLIEAYGVDRRWRMSYNPMIPGMILNVPDARGYQFFLQVRGKAWSRFESWYANDFHYVNGIQYFAGVDGLYRAFFGDTDSGMPITARSVGAPTSLAGLGYQTEVGGVRPYFRSEGAFSYGVAIFENLTTEVIENLYSLGGAGGMIWNVSNWNQANWAGAVADSSNWHTPPTDPADRIALGLQIFTNSGAVSWQGWDCSYKGTRDW